MYTIKEIRQERGITQKALAEMAGVSQPYVHDLENGNRGISKETLRRFADALGVPPESLKIGKDADHGAA